MKRLSRASKPAGHPAGDQSLPGICRESKPAGIKAGDQSVPEIKACRVSKPAIEASCSGV